MVERVAALPLASEPGTVWRYSIGLDVMGAVIERITGQAFDVFLRERVFDPLDMRSTGFQVAPQDAARLTTNYAGTGEPLDPAATSAWLQPPTLMAGGGGLVSTARDLARFGEMLLGDGALGSVRVMKVATARLARSNLLPSGVSYPDGGGFGAGGRVVVAAGGHKFGPPGSFGWGGAAGTLWRIDPARQANLVFTIQHMPPHPFDLYEAVGAAVETDLAR
jgi:CubicO group peptidase (beta-lactamase class C family)